MKKLVGMLLLAVCLAAPQIAAATQSLRTINYQGRLTDASGTVVADAPPASRYTITFRLYAAEGDTIANAVWSETQSNIAVKNGYFNVALGSVAPLNSKDLDFNNQYWLGVEVGSDGEMTPRQSLNAAPAALQSDVPIGTILAWHPNMTRHSGEPALVLPAQWVLCNGKVINDSESPFYLENAPNLNGDATGADSPSPLTGKQKLFLRGGPTSGVGENDAFQGHWHNANPGSFEYYIGSTGGVSGMVGGTEFNSYSYTGGAANDGISGAPRTTTETRPKSMSVVWIMKIK